MNAKLENLAEFVLGRRDLPSIAARTVFGVIGPAIALAYGMRCVLSQHAMILGKGSLDQISGPPAVAAGIAYSLASVAAYVYVCWDDHPKFAGLRDFVLQLLLVAIAILYAASITLALL